MCAVAVVLATACGVVASSGEVPGWEEAIFHAINDLPDWLKGPMWVFQLAGLLFVPLVVAVGAAAFRRWRLAAALAVFVPLKLIVEKLVVKQLVERDRPGTTICGAPDDFDETCGNFRGDVPLDGLSFVSGHAIIAWGVATLLWPVLPARWRWLPVAIASLNAVARIYLGAHNPLDVIGGGAVGVTIGAVLVIVFNPADTSIPFRRRGEPAEAA
ncbi:MAG TPA: phosphatase PAP2 family protein [Acidimicrobiales bacterium]|nr:phosphatase PAP2 family protein [Acidimicrobiales bacterium]